MNLKLAFELIGWKMDAGCWKISWQSFYDDGLKDKFEKMDYFGFLRKKIYPNDPFFKAPEPPPSPKFTQ